MQVLVDKKKKRKKEIRWKDRTKNEIKVNTYNIHDLHDNLQTNLKYKI